MNDVNTALTVPIRLRQFVWWLSFFWTVAVGITFSWALWSERNHARKVAEEVGRAILEKEMSFYRWNAGGGGIYVPASVKSPPDITTSSGLRLTLVRPSMMMGELEEGLGKGISYRSHLANVHPTNEENAPDAWERKALDAFANGESEVSSIDESDGQTLMRVMGPVFAASARRHEMTGNSDRSNVLVGGISVSVPIKAVWAVERGEIVRRLIGYGGMWGLGLGGILLAAHHLQNQIRLRQSAENQLMQSQIVLEQQVAERTRAEESVRMLAGKILNAQEAERGRIARDMHDDLTQRIAVLAIQAGKLEQESDASRALSCKLQQMKDHLIRLSQDVHALSRQLHPSILDDLGLVEALRSESANFSQREEIAVRFTPQDVPEEIPKDVALCLYRITQEGLRNIAKHAEAREARVSLTAADDSIMLSIEDDGIGFDYEATKGKLGLGLASMEERARLIGGELTIRSEPQRGTLIEVLVPWPGRTS